MWEVVAQYAFENTSAKSARVRVVFPETACRPGDDKIDLTQHCGAFASMQTTVRGKSVPLRSTTERKTVTLGTLTVERVVADSANAEKVLLFLPSQVPDGIEPSDDPMIKARDDAYAVSFGRRSR